MEDVTDNPDMSKYGCEARIYSADGKYEQIFIDESFLEKINQCEHLTALHHKTKDIILQVEKTLSPLKPHAASLFIETKGGSVVAKMSLEDFFNMLDLGKRIEIKDRFRKESPSSKDGDCSVNQAIFELLNRLDSV
jgi:hypothetical protein